MQKLAMSKKIMDAQDRIPRGQSAGLPMNEINATYNIPTEYTESQPSVQVQQPVQQSVQPITEDKINNSKLPDHIKKLMLENPIQQPNVMGFGGGAVLTDEIIEGATRLMGNNTQTQPQRQPQGQPVLENNDLKQMIRDVVRDTVRDVVKEELQKAGMISEGAKADELLQLKVGSHIFEGRITKIKKLK